MSSGVRDQAHPGVLDLDPKGEQPLVDGAEVTDRQVAVVDRLAADSVELVERGGEQRVGHRAPHEEGISTGGEEAAVVLVDSEGRVSAIDDAKQGAEVVVEVVRRRAEHTVRVEISGQRGPLRPDAVARVVRIAHWKEPAGLGVQAEEKAVEQNQRVVEGLVERLTRAGVVLEQTVGDQGHRGEHLALERIAHLNGVGPALLARPIEEGLPRGVRTQ